MTPIDLQRLLAPCHAEAPAGDDLVYRPDFVELMQLARGTPDVEYGSMRVEAAEPPWAEIEIRVMELMRETHDIRLAVLFTRASLARHGLEGLAGGLALVDGLLRQEWAGLHPRLDPDDALDPTERLNILAELAAPSFLTRLNDTSIIDLPRLGSLRLGDFQARGNETGDGGPSPESIAAALQDMEAGTVAHARQTIADCVDHAQGIDRTLGEHTGHGHALAQLIAQIRPALERLRHASGDTPAGAATQIADRSSGEITSRSDIARQLERICDYYRQHEPASPIPILLQRARRLLDMDFLELMADLAPNALADIRALSGPADD
jgi:type VI secretion system protein ImpA